jgi:hypothetical protein
MHYAGCPGDHINARSNENARAAHGRTTASRPLLYMHNVVAVVVFQTTKPAASIGSYCDCGTFS